MCDTRESPAPEPRSRKRFWASVLGIPLALAAASLVGWMVSQSMGLNRVVAETDRLDPGWRVQDLLAARPKIPPEQNAFTTIQEVKAALPAGWPDPKLDERLEWSVPNEQLRPDQITALKSILGAAQPALSRARTLLDRPGGFLPIDDAQDFFSTPMPLLEHRQAARLLSFDALDRAQLGDARGALESCQACFHCGSSIGGEPTLMAMLIRIACQAIAIRVLERCLAQGEPGEAELARFQQRLETEAAAPILLQALRGERAGGFQLFTQMRAGQIPGAVGGGTGNNLLQRFMNLPGFLTMQQAGHLEFMNEMVELAKQPSEAWIPALKALQARVKKLPIMVQPLVPAIEKAGQAAFRDQANLQCARAALAAERFRLKHQRWPANLEDLVQAGFLSAMPQDPFTHQPLHFRRLPDGILIYSVGLDGNDDGGKILRANPNQPGTDLGFQLWDPPARRRPAPPPPTPPKSIPDEPGPGEPGPGEPEARPPTP